MGPTRSSNRAGGPSYYKQTNEFNTKNSAPKLFDCFTSSANVDRSFPLLGGT